MKYDCSKTLDYIHEWNRMCSHYLKGPDKTCKNCPLDMYDYICNETSPQHLQIVQAWSDSHPEIFYITSAEKIFLESLVKIEDLYATRISVDELVLTYYCNSIEICNTMFPFIEIDEPWSVKELLALEVKDE